MGDKVYKIGIALLIALLAAIITFIAGCLTEARIETALIRGLKCFLIFGMLLMAAGFIFEKFNLSSVLLKQQLADKAENTKGQSEAGTDGTDEEKENAESEEAEPSEEEAEGGFVPLGADNLRRVSTQ